MAKLLKLRRGTDTQHSSFTGAEGEVTVNTTNDSLHVHDGSTAGGTELAKADLSNVDGSLSNDLGFGDSVKATFGTSNDLEIFHDGTNSWVKDVGTNALVLDSNGPRVTITKSGATETMANFNTDGSVQLFHDNSEKLATTSTGINVTGTVTCDGIQADGVVLVSTATSKGLRLQDSDDTGDGAEMWIQGVDSAGTQKWFVGDVNNTPAFYVGNSQGGDIIFKTDNVDRVKIASNGSSFFPNSNNATDLGTASQQWRNGYFDGTVTCDGLSCNGSAVIESGVGVLSVKDNNNTGNNTENYIQGVDSSDAQKWYLGYASTANSDLYISNVAGGEIRFRSSNTDRIYMQAAGHLVPATNNAQDLGLSTLRWRNIYTNDLNLSNEGGSNDVDGTWGSWTIQEGEDDLFLLNRRNGKKYKFNLSEVN